LAAKRTFGNAAMAAKCQRRKSILPHADEQSGLPLLRREEFFTADETIGLEKKAKQHR
jgi:hypothetical protein